MSNKNMNWNQFLTEYMLRAMTNREFFEEYSAQHITEFARQAWDAIQAAELPESEKAKEAPAPSFVSTAGLAPIPSNSMELKELARKAREITVREMQWIAIDRDGSVWAYDLQPGVSELAGNWDNSDDGGFAWEITQIAPPDNFLDELYEINKLLKDENE